MFERFTDDACIAMALANAEAKRYRHEYIGTEHILLGLVEEEGGIGRSILKKLGLVRKGSGVGAKVIKNLGIDLRKIRPEVEKLIKSGAETVTMRKLPSTGRAKKVIEYAIEEVRNLKQQDLGTEHLLLGLLREHEGIAAQVLMNLGLKADETRNEVIKLSGSGSAMPAHRV